MIIDLWHSKDVANVEANVFKSCKDDFCIPKHHYSTPLRDSNAVLISNAQFLPPPDARLEEFHWEIAAESGLQALLPSPTTVSFGFT